MSVVVRSLIVFLSMAAAAPAQLDFERSPILYSKSEPTDRVAQLASDLAAGTQQLDWEPAHGYLVSLLRALDVPISSQTLVFSKTSLQISRISPRTPRAIYFNDDVYVGWVQHGREIEISAADPALGGTFYSLHQNSDQPAAIKRETSRCLQCHGSTHTRRIPGHIVRSVYADERGQPVYRLGTHLTDHASPYDERFGGWYVTGTHGDLRHMGNTWLPDPDENEELDTGRHANLTDLSPLMDTSPYLSPHSDIVALLVLQHQVRMHNVLTAASHSGRLTARDAVTMNRALERPPDFESDSTKRRYASAAEKVIRALLFVGEPTLASPMRGTSDFTMEFSRRTPANSAAASLREFDLQRRLFRTPCSFLIDSESFKSLPPGVKSRVFERLATIVRGDDDSEEFSHLTAEHRQTIRSVLKQLR